MKPGTYSEKSRRLTGTNMDVPVRLKANHSTGQLFLAIECKVSNSSLNSRKRLLEVHSKRETWDSSGLPHRFRTAAVIAGVFDVARLFEAQNAGVLLFWEHRLKDGVPLPNGLIQPQHECSWDRVDPTSHCVSYKPTETESTGAN